MPAFGFFDGLMHTQSENVQSHERAALAIAFPLDRKDCQPPFEIQLDRYKSVSVPSLRLKVPTSSDAP